MKGIVENTCTMKKRSNTMGPLYLLALLITMGCNMKEKQEQDLSQYQELHGHKGTENYEVVEIFPKELSCFEDFSDTKPEIFIDTVEKSLIAYGWKEQKLEENIHKLSKVSRFGDIEDEEPLLYELLKDGTLYWPMTYCNWVIDGDTSENKYLDPFSGKEIEDIYDFPVPETDPKKWLAKFEEYYGKAIYVNIDKNSSGYYMKTDNKWYFIDSPWGKLREKLKINNFEKRYPAKEGDIRMLELQDLTPHFFVPPHERDTSLIKETAYRSTVYERNRSNFGLNQDYSAGWWYLEVYMPGGDTLRIKRYASFRRPDMYFYKIPKEHGGVEEVLFLVQKPSDMHMEQVGGMYAIRPRNYKEGSAYREMVEERERKAQVKVGMATYRDRETAEYAQRLSREHGENHRWSIIDDGENDN